MGPDRQRRRRVRLPGGIALARDGRLFVADQTNRRVQVFSGDGKLLAKWGEHGSKPGQFGGAVSLRSRVGGPQFMALDADGNVFTTEGSECRVQKFTPEGKFLRGLTAEPGSSPGQFIGPHGVVLDSMGNLYVVDAYNHRVQKFATR